MPENNLKNYALLHMIVFIWGFTAILGALISIEAIPLVFFRMGLATIFIGLYFFAIKKNVRTDSSSLLKFFGTGILIAVHWIFFFQSVKVSNVSVALVTMSTGAFFTSLVEPFFYNRRIRFIEIILGSIVILGLYIIFNFESQYKLGIIYALMSAFLASLFTVFNGIFVKSHDADKISFYQLGFGTIGILIFLFFQNEFTSELFNLSLMDWFYLFVLSSVCTAFAFIMSVKIMKYLSPYTVMLTINLEPIYGIILALLIFGEKEQMNVEFYIGAMIVFSVVLANGIIKNRDQIKNKIALKSKRKK